MDSTKNSKSIIVEGHASEVLANEKLQEQYFDVVLVSSDKIEISAHRLVLASCSPVFSRMFSSGMKESTNNRIILNEINGNSLRQLIDYFYSGKIEINMNNVAELLRAITFLQCASVQKECEKYLMELLEKDLDSCFFIHELANCYDFKELNVLVEQSMLNNFPILKNCKEFLQLDFIQMKKILLNDNINIAGEEDIFAAVVAWINYDRLNREPFYLDLLQTVRFSGFDDLFLKGPVKEIYKSINALKAYEELEEKNNSSEKSSLLPRGQTYLGGLHNRKTKVYAIISIDNAIVITSFCFATKKWIFERNFNTNFLTATRLKFLAQEKKELHFFNGGYDSVYLANLKLNTMELEDEDDGIDDTPSDCLPMAAMINNQKYVFVCECNENLLDNLVQRYTCKAYKIPGGRSKATIIEFLNGLLFIGGKTQTERSSQVDFFDTTNDSWHSMPPMINKRKQPGAAVYKGLLYVIGGKNPTAEQYDPQTKAWSLIQIPDDVKLLKKFSLASIDDGLLVSGVIPDNERTVFVQKKYCPEKNEWSDFSSINSDGSSFVQLISVDI